MSSEANKPEPVGYFRALPFGWEDCAATDDGAQALYDEGAIRTQAARIAELEAERFSRDVDPAFAPLASNLAEKLAQVEAERDQLRAEVERLKREKARAIDTAGHMLAAGSALSNGAFNLKQRVGEPLSTHDVAALDSAQRAWDRAIEAAKEAK
jgi:hypothetical protein